MLDICGAEDKSQGLEHIRQALYQLSYILHFYLFYPASDPADSPSPPDQQHPQGPQGHHPSQAINSSGVDQKGSRKIVKRGAFSKETR